MKYKSKTCCYKCGQFNECKKLICFNHNCDCHSTKDVELERVLEEFDKLVIKLNANYGTDNYREFITQVYTQAKQAGFKEGVEEERKRILKALPKEETKTYKQGGIFSAFDNGFNECLYQVKKII